MKILKTLNTNKDILVDDFNYDRLKHLKIYDTGSGLQIHYKRGNNGIKNYLPLSKIILLTTANILDHKDRNYLNNQIDNLRSATISQNKINSKLQRNNTSGFKGVCFYKARNKWVAYIKVNG